MDNLKPQPVGAKPQDQNKKPQKKRAKRLLTKNGDQVLETKSVLDALLEQGSGLPGEVKKAVASARDVCWEAFKAEQERQMQMYS